MSSITADHSIVRHDEISEHCYGRISLGKARCIGSGFLLAFGDFTVYFDMYNIVSII